MDFLKVYFSKVYFSKVYFPKVYFPKMYFLKVYFLKVYFPKTFLTQSLPSPNFFKPSVPGEVRVFRAFASLFQLVDQRQSTSSALDLHWPARFPAYAAIRCL